MNVKVKDRRTGKMVILEVADSEQDKIGNTSPEELSKIGKPIAIQISESQWVIDNGLSNSSPQWEPVDEVPEFDNLPITGEMTFPEDSDVAEALELYAEDDDGE